MTNRLTVIFCPKVCDILSVYFSSNFAVTFCPNVTKGPFLGKIRPFLLKCPHFAEKPAGHGKRVRKNPETKNVHSLLSRWQDIKNVQKSCDKMSTLRWKEGWTFKRVRKNPVTKCPHVAKQLAGHHKCVPNVVTNRPNFASGKGGHDVTEHFFWGGWTLCHKWQTVHLEAGVDEKYVDGSYRWTNVTVVNCHSRRFVGWMLSVGRNVAWSVCGWMDHQGTPASYVHSHIYPPHFLVSQNLFGTFSVCLSFRLNVLLCTVLSWWQK